MKEKSRQEIDLMACLLLALSVDGLLISRCHVSMMATCNEADAWFARRTAVWAAKPNAYHAVGAIPPQEQDRYAHAATALTEVAVEAAKLADLQLACEAGEGEACLMLDEEDEAKKAWLKKLDERAWNAAAAAVSQVAGAASSDEASAKASWLSKLDQPQWGEAAQAVHAVAAEATKLADLQASCDAGAEKACTEFSSEADAKEEWLSKLDVPAWGNVADAVSAVAAEAPAPAPGAAPGNAAADEAAAKAAWLKKLDLPDRPHAATVSVAQAAARATASAFRVDEVPTSAIASQVPRPSVNVEEAAAKAKWLASIDTPRSAAKPSSRVAGPPPPKPYRSGAAERAAPPKVGEAAAKRAWLKKADAAWGR